MEMIFKYHIGIKFEVIFFLEDFEGVHHDVHTLLSCEDRQPVKYGTGDKMWMCRFVYFVSCSSHLGIIA